jgi:hypothetical protein
MIGEWGETFFKQWEKMFATFMEQLVRNQAFLAHMGKLLEGSSMFRMIVDTSMRKALESMQIPTRRDIEEVLAVLRKVEMALAKAELDNQELRSRLDALLRTKVKK